MLVGNYFYNYALNTKQEKEFLEDNPHLVETVNASGDVLATNEEKDVNFVSNHKPNTLHINSFDKLEWRSWEDRFKYVLEYRMEVRGKIYSSIIRFIYTIIRR